MEPANVNPAPVTEERPWKDDDACHLKLEEKIMALPMSTLRAMPGLAQIIEGQCPMHGGKASTANDPLFIPDCTRNAFERLLDVMQGQRMPSPELSNEDWIDVLALSAKWNMKTVSTLAATKVIPLLPPLEKARIGKLFNVGFLFLEGCCDLSRPGIPAYGGLGLEALAAALGWETGAKIAYSTLLTSEAMKNQPGVIALDTLSCLSCHTPKLLFSIDVRRAESGRPPQGGQGIKVEVGKVLRYRHPEGYVKFPDISRFWYCKTCSEANNGMFGKLSINLGDTGGLRYGFPYRHGLDYDNVEIIKHVFAEDLKAMVL